MATATRVTDQLRGKAGEAYGYELSEPFHGVSHLIVSRVDMAAWGLRETRIVPAMADDIGQVVMLRDGDNTMALSIPLELCSHAEALASIGYEIAEMAEVPPGDPDVKIEPTLEAES
ncbi:hypothetical protein [Rhodococcoides fascians]|uniref:hypothetical protein n=1 Tax=Rhodococcoides fascians TaxID=1828 RepID=UPI000AE5BBB8|nr:hypothetical protein [Rhodococcus fascians]